MSLLIFLQFVCFFAAFSLVLMAAVTRRFGPGSWLLVFVLAPSCACAGILAAPALFPDLTPEKAVKFAFSFLLLAAPGGYLFTQAIACENYLDRIRAKYLVAVSLIIGALVIMSAVCCAYPDPLWVPGLLKGSVPLGPAGFGAALYLLISAVTVLANLELTFRAADERTRWEIKFLLLGLGLLYASIIYIASKILLYSHQFAPLSMESINLFPVALLVSVGLMLVSWRRSSGHGQVVVTHRVIYSSITLFSVGIYLTLSSLVAHWLGQLGQTGLPIEALLFLLSILALAVLMLGTAFRHRAQRWIRRNVLAGRFDYRKIWLEASERVQSTDPPKVSAGALAEFIHRAVGTADISVWMRLSAPNRLQLLAARGSIAGELPAEVFDVVEKYLGVTGPIAVSDGEELAEARNFLRATRACLLVPLVSSGRTVGLITLGSGPGEEALDWDAQEFLQVLANHAAGEFHKRELLSKLVEAKETEAFRIFSTFLLHDLKNFASTLSLMAKNAVRHQENPDFQKDAFQSVFEIAEKMKRLCNNLKTFSSAIAANKKWNDLNKLVLEVADDLKVGMTPRLQLELGDLPQVLLDVEEVRRVLQNLVINASEAIPENGSIVVRTARVNGSVELSVEDNGKGIPREFLQKELFLPFHTTKSRGLGIGLFQAKRIMDAHQGMIIVESEERKGTLVKLLFPIALNDQSTNDSCGFS